MTKYLKDAVKYSSKRISADEITLENYVTTDNLLQNKQGKTNVESLPPNGGNVTAYENGDILISNIRPYLKKLWFANQSGGSSADVLTFKVRQGFEPKFIYYSVFRDLFFDHMMNGSKGTKMPRGDKNQILDFPIPNFPLSTQKSIAKVLSDLDAKIELNNKINRELEAMAKTLFDYWFVQFDFPFDYAQGKPYANLNDLALSGVEGYKSSGGKMVYNAELKREIPEGWEVKSIEKFIEVKDGTHDSPKPTSTGYHLITSKNLLESGLDFENANLISEEDYININKRSQVETGDILFSMIGSIGILYKVEESNINFAIKNVALYKSSLEFEFRNYILQYLKSYDMKRYMGNVISGSIQKFIGLGSLRKMPFLFNRDVIDEFNNRTKEIYQKLDNNKRQNQHLTALRDWLLPMLMNGQVSVRQAHGKLEAEEKLGMAAEPVVKYGKE